MLRGNETAERFRELDNRCNFGLDPRRRSAQLRLADQQKVEIMRAIARDARVIVMDEPTSSLTADEAERLHEVIAGSPPTGARSSTSRHFLDEVLAVATPSR